MNQENQKVNLRKITFIQKIKQYFLKLKYGNGVVLKGGLRLFGALPIFKIPGNGKIILGDKVVLNSDFRNSNTALTYRCTLVCGLNGRIEIGSNSMLNGVCVTAYQSVQIGENCQIASGTLITDTDYHPVSAAIRELEVLGHPFDRDLVNKKSVNIGNNVWIGWGCIILKGVTIGENTIIGAGSVVTKSVPSNVLVAGNPAVVVKDL